MSLPDELVREILSRLPSLKSAFRLCCLCKSWSDLITKDRDFRDQLSNRIHSRSTENDDPFLVFFKPGFKQNNNECVIRAQNSRIFGRVNFPRFEGFGSCNGVLCFRQWYPRDFHVHLYNPITREHHEISDSRKVYEYGEGLGFGFDSNNNDYKVISINKKNGVEIYSLKTKCWSKLHVGSSIFYDGDWSFCPDFVSLDGCCFWRFLVGNSRSNSQIISFDFRTETFSLIDLPGTGFISAHLCVLNNSLALCLTDCPDTPTKVWVLSEGREKWAKKFSILDAYLPIMDFHAYWIYDGSLFEFGANGKLNTDLRTKEKEGEGAFAGARMFTLDLPRHPLMIFKPSLVSLRSGSFIPASND